VSPRTRRLCDRITRALARFLVAIFFRSAEAQGLERVPATAAVLFVANHGNALIDPLVLVARLPRLPRFLGQAHALEQSPRCGRCSQLAGAVPVYRAQEGDTARNQETFARCLRRARARRRGRAVPGGHQSRPARAAAAQDGRGADRAWARARRAPSARDRADRAHVRGQGAVPLAAAPVRRRAARRARRAPDDADAVRALTEAIDAGCAPSRSTPTRGSTAKLLARAAEIYGGDPERVLPGVAALGSVFPLRRAFGEGYEAARVAAPSAWPRSRRWRAATSSCSRRSACATTTSPPTIRGRTSRAM
jgi:hypothetical protein